MSPPAEPLSNVEIAERLMSLAQLLAAQKENPFKVKAYRRAAQTIRALSESIDQLVRSGADLTAYSGIGAGIASAIREIVLSGSLAKLETLRSEIGPELAEINRYRRLDQDRVLRIYKKLKISSIDELRQKLASGEIASAFGVRMDRHIRTALSENQEVLLHTADPIAAEVANFLRRQCGAERVEFAGAYRRRLEVIDEICVLIATTDFPSVVSKLKRYGGRSAVVLTAADHALFRLPSGIVLRVRNAAPVKWGLAWIEETGSDAHVEELERSGMSLATLAKAKAAFRDEAAVYRKAGLSFIEPELREGQGEIELARGALPNLVTARDIRGELHAHTTASDGSFSIERMAQGARAKGYEYIGITDHSQSLKIAHGLPEQDLLAQIRSIDRLNQATRGIRILKSAEVDILEEGALDYPDALLKELDYTVCSIHSRFSLDKARQTSRILRAMDNRYFNILGHATGRMLLRRPGYEIDLERVVEHAKQNGCFFEINSNPNRLDLSSENARIASAAGIKIAISTDAHSLRELDFLRCGIDQARRAGLERGSILNCLPWLELAPLFKR